MKRIFGFLTVLALVALPLGVSAQQGSQVTIAPTPSVAVQPFVTATAADEGAINKQLTITIVPPPGQYFYLTNMAYSAFQNATGSALVNALFTQTGFTNLPINQLGSAAASVDAGTVVTESYGIYPVKSKTPGATVTFVSPAANAQVAFTYHVYGFFAP